MSSGRVMALDLSTRKTGLAWGRIGKGIEGTTTIFTTKGQSEAQNLWSMAEAIAIEVQDRRCGFVIFSEFYSNRNLLALRANASLRGAVMARLAKDGIEALPVAEITARKAAGVDITKRKADEPKAGWMKGRARARLEALGLGGLQEDEGDAAILLLGAKAVIETGEDDAKE